MPGFTTDLQTGGIPTSLIFVFCSAIAIVIVSGEESVKEWKTYSALTGPLAHLPGPRVSKWTELRLQLAVMTGERVRYEHALHKQYGPVLRLSPREVSLASVSAAKVIYQVGSPYLKPSWYGDATGIGPVSIFTMRDPKEHSARRRLLAHNYSENWVKQMEPYIAEKTRFAVTKIADDMERMGYADVNKWFTLMATDVVSEAAFGESFDCLKIGEKTQYIRDVENDGLRGVLRAEFPLLGPLVSYLVFGSKEITEGLERMRAYAQGRLDRYWDAYREDPDNVKPTLLGKAFSAFADGTLSRNAIQCDAMTNIVAGTDTTATTSTYATWYLSKDPQLEKDLIREVTALPSDFNDEQLRELPLLNRVIKETLRIRPSVGQGLPRLVPTGGAHFEGHFIPEGTTINIPAYSMHHLDSVWQNPESFDPSRWETPTKEMQNSFLPFGGGRESSLYRFAFRAIGTSTCPYEFLSDVSFGLEACGSEWIWREGYEADLFLCYFSNWSPMLAGKKIGLVLAPFEPGEYPWTLAMDPCRKFPS